jgi:hypothetical protein
MAYLYMNVSLIQVTLIVQKGINTILRIFRVITPPIVLLSLDVGLVSLVMRVSLLPHERGLDVRLVCLCYNMQTSMKEGD